MGKTITLGFNDFRKVFISLEQGLEGFCNQYLATKTTNSVPTIAGILKIFGRYLLRSTSAVHVITIVYMYSYLTWQNIGGVKYWRMLSHLHLHLC